MRLLINGQSMIEALLALPMILLILAAIGQYSWIFIEYHVLQSAALHGARTASLDGGNTTALRVELHRRMRVMPGLNLHIPRITRLLPTDEELSQQLDVEQRITGESGEQLAIDFPSLRFSLMPERHQAQFLKVRRLQYEITWCQPLHLPVVGKLIATYATLLAKSDAHLYCQAQGVGRPMFGHQVRAAVPLLSPLQVR